MKNVTLLGAGLVGSLLAVYMRRRGYAVDIYERRPDLRKADAYGGRSINLALSDRGFRALEKVGLADEVRSVGIPMYGRMMHDEKGQLSYQAYGKEGQAIYSVSRGGLNFKMMDLAENEGVRIHFNMRSTEVDLDEKIVHFEKGDTRQKMSVPYELLFGSDGAFSALRGSFQKRDRFDYSQDYLSAGYKELTIPAGPGGTFRMEKNALHIWPRGSYMMIALPNPDGSFTCTLFFPFDGPDSFASLKTREDVAGFFNRTMPDAVALMPTLLDDYFNNPTSSLVTVKCSPWIHENHSALIGDAAHAIVPFYGQGMNCGFEDVFVLDELINQYGEDWSQILPAYQQSRKPDGDAIADLAKANFIEMRDKVADADFLLRKKIESKIYQLYPEKWIPLYTMVTFSPDIRYAEALRLGQVQDRIMDEVMARPDIRLNWEDAATTTFIHNLMTHYDKN